MFDSLRIRWKLGLVLALPVLALLAMTVVIVGDAGQEARDAEQRADVVRAQAEFATASLGPGGVIDKLQDERAGDLARMAGVESIYDDAKIRPDTDKAADAYRQAVSEQSAEVQEAYAPALAAIDELDALRAEVDGIIEAGNVDVLAAAETLWDDYSALITQVYEVNTAAVAEIDDPTLRTGAVLTDLGIRYKEGMANLATAVAQNAALGRLDTPASITEISDTNARVDTLLSDIELNAKGPYAQIVQDTVRNEDYKFVLDFYDLVVAGEDVTLEDASGPEISERNSYVVGFIDQVGVQLQEDADAVVAAAEQEADDASQRQVTVALVAGLVLVLAIGAGLLASRSITRPLHRLTSEANSIANDRLPGAVKEILDSPHGRGRGHPRAGPGAHQGRLRDRRGGHRPQHGAGQCGRARRGAGGAAPQHRRLVRQPRSSQPEPARPPARRHHRHGERRDRLARPWSSCSPSTTWPPACVGTPSPSCCSPVRSRTASGRRRCRSWTSSAAPSARSRSSPGSQISRLDEVSVKGSSAADLTHMIAELLENALSFSPPTTTVEMATMTRGGRCMLLIVDNGVGMEPQDLALANTRLSGEESFTVAPSRYLGHYVVGIQAQRLGVTVDLIDTPTGGITARLDITALLETEEVEVPSSPDEETSPLNVEVPDSPAALDEAPQAGEPAERAPTSVSASPPRSPRRPPRVRSWTGRLRPLRPLPPARPRRSW